LVPRNWSACNGQIIAISSNEALFSLIGTTYGGNGTNTFALPDLRARAPIHQGTLNGNTSVLGQRAGEANVTLTIATLPAHTHLLLASSTSDASAPSPSTAPGGGGAAVYGAPPVPGMNTSIIGQAGQSQPHNNVQPFLALNICICVSGIFPSRN